MEFDTKYLADPEVFRINRLDAVSSHNFYASKDEMKDEKSSFIHCLNGVWKFRYANSLNQVIKEFKDEDYDTSNWDDIKVPGHVELQGYGNVMYVNQQYPWSGKEGILPGEIPLNNPVNSYVTYFDSSILKQDCLTRIVFHGAESGLTLWVNGKFVGYSEDSFTPSSFDITDYIKQGKNKIAVNVYRFTSGSWLEDQDFFRFSGIFRDVELVSIPRVHINDLKITQNTDDLTCPIINVKTSILSDTSYILKMTLFNKDGDALQTIETSDSASFKVDNAHLWWDEDPYLYTLEIEVISDNKLIECVKQKIGIRRFELKDGIMYINHKRILFHGVNRHEFSCDRGRVMDKQTTKQDLINMKKNNINAVRTCHYPNNNFFYDLCDEIGLYVIDETNMETHGTWSEFFDMEHVIPGDDPKWLNNIIDRANSMVERDKNHPCVIIWSCGNESWGGKDILEMSNFIRKKDPSRLVHYEGVANDTRYPETSDMISRMYPPVVKVEEILKDNPNTPMLLCEFAHSMGNSNGALYKYTDLEKKYPNYQGGFIWDYIDQALLIDGKLCYGGDNRDRPSDYDFCGNGIMFADRTPTPKLQEVKYCYRWIDTAIDENKIVIENNYYTKDLANFKTIISLIKDGDMVDKKKLVLNCKPGDKLIIDNPFKVDNDGEYAVNVSYFENDNEVSYAQYVYPYKKEERHARKKLSFNEDFQNVGVVGDNFNAIFSKTKGLVSYKVNSYEFIRVPLRPNFFRAATNNDCENFYGFRYGQWLLNSLYCKLQYIGYKTQEYSVTVMYKYTLPSLPDNILNLEYTVYGDGEIVVDMNLDAFSDHIEMPEFGILLQTYSELDNVNYYGLGDKENYIDRNKGARLGKYEYKVEDNLTPYLFPQECGNRTGVRSLVVGNDRHHLMIDGLFEFSALPYTPYELENAKHHYELPDRYQTVISICEKQMGVGGDNTWGALTHDEFLLDKNKHHLRVSIKGE